jgi:glycerol-3-phosphate dehydrogenase
MGTAIEPLEDSPEHDVAVIGGGILGTGVARDCALRGMKVALFEKHDWGAGASGLGSCLILGSALDLTGPPKITSNWRREGDYLHRIAPHLVLPVPFLVPIPARGWASRSAVAAVDALFTSSDRDSPIEVQKPHPVLTADQARALEPGLRGDIRGAVIFDDWGIDGVRLCLANMLDAREHGASCYAHHEVIALLRDPVEKGGAVRGVVARDRETGTTIVATARRVVNATGAWAPITAGLAAGVSVPARVRKNIQVVFDRRLGHYAVVCRVGDGPPIVWMPWQNVSHLGTTDAEYDGDLDDVRATADEVRYLVEGAAEMFSDIAEARVIGTIAGARSTLDSPRGSGAARSAEHAIIDHAGDGAPHLYSMIGGQLATYRIFAQEMSDHLAAELGVRSPCRTHENPLPGGEARIDVHDLAERFRLAEPAARRLASRHGARATEIVLRCTRNRYERAIVCPCEPGLEAEVRYAVRVEGARDVSDVARRTRLGLGPCGGMRCAHRAAQIIAQERLLSPSRAHVMAAQFLIERFRSRVVALDGVQVRQEELALARYVGAGLGRAVESALADSNAQTNARPSFEPSIAAFATEREREIVPWNRKANG